jgi:hypothetical protein
MATLVTLSAHCVSGTAFDLERHGCPANSMLDSWRRQPHCPREQKWGLIGIDRTFLGSAVPRQDYAVPRQGHGRWGRGLSLLIGRIVTVLRLRRRLSRCRIGAGGYRKRDASEHERAYDGVRGLRKQFVFPLCQSRRDCRLYETSHDSHFQFSRTSHIGWPNHCRQSLNCAVHASTSSASDLASVR